MKELQQALDQGLPPFLHWLKKTSSVCILISELTTKYHYARGLLNTTQLETLLAAFAEANSPLPQSTDACQTLSNYLIHHSQNNIPPAATLAALTAQCAVHPNNLLWLLNFVGDPKWAAGFNQNVVASTLRAPDRENFINRLGKKLQLDTTCVIQSKDWTPFHEDPTAPTELGRWTFRPNHHSTDTLANWAYHTKNTQMLITLAAISPRILNVLSPRKLDNLPGYTQIHTIDQQPLDQQHKILRQIFQWPSQKQRTNSFASIGRNIADIPPTFQQWPWPTEPSPQTVTTGNKTWICTPTTITTRRSQQLAAVRLNSHTILINQLHPQSTTLQLSTEAMGVSTITTFFIPQTQNHSNHQPEPAGTIHKLLLLNQEELHTNILAALQPDYITDDLKNTITLCAQMREAKLLAGIDSYGQAHITQPILAFLRIAQTTSHYQPKAELLVHLL